MALPSTGDCEAAIVTVGAVLVDWFFVGEISMPSMEVSNRMDFASEALLPIAVNAAVAESVQSSREYGSEFIV